MLAQLITLSIQYGAGHINALVNRVELPRLKFASHKLGMLVEK